MSLVIFSTIVRRKTLRRSWTNYCTADHFRQALKRAN